MVRVISNELRDAQQAASVTPYTYLLFTSKGGGTTYDYSSDQGGRRILAIDHNEEPYNDYALIILRNDDRTIPDMRGYWTEIGYGAVTGETVALPNGNGDDAEFSKTPRLWVKSQQTISQRGKVYDILEMEGMWARLREVMISIGDPPYYQDEDQELADLTPYAIIARVLLEVDSNMTLAALGTQDDSIINTLTTPFSVNVQPFEYAAEIVRALIEMTKCYLRLNISLEFEVRYPQSGDSVNLNYYSDQAFYFYEYMERKNVQVPNSVAVYANQSADGSWGDVITGTAVETTDGTNIYDEVLYYELAAELTTQADADNRADAILARMRAELLAGRLIAPHDCRVELYDKIKIWDNR